MSTEREPCPFCGDVMNLRTINCGDEFSVSCRQCGITGAWRDTAEDAIAAWNRRPGEDALLQQLDELARTVLAVAYPVGMSQHVCQLCLGVRGAHADGCPAARATAHLHEGK